MKKKMYQRPDGLFEKAMVIDGKKVHFYGKTEREVFLKISEYKKVSRNGKTVTELADDWLGTIEKEISPSTYEGYKATCNKIINYFGKTYARTLTEKDIEKFVDALPELTRGGSISKKTAINTLAILNQIFRFGIKNGHLELNPRQNVHVPKNLSKNPREAITEKQIGIITEQGKAHPEDTAALIAIFALYTGLRRGELICLQRSDIDFKNRLINVTKSVFFDSNKPKWKDPKTAAGYRVVALPDFLADLIPKREGFLFSLDDGKSMLLKSQLNDIWIKYQIDNGLVGVGLHNLRHTYASLLYDAGIDVKMAQSLLGHADISTTQNIYTHILKKKQERDFAALNSYFDQLNRVDDM